MIKISNMKEMTIKILCDVTVFQLRSFDPFLMLDEFKVAAPAGFPDHPHRGFETVREFRDDEMTESCIAK